MNKRKRQLLDALAPAADFALNRTRGPVRSTALSFRVRADATDTAELSIYGQIGGGGWFSDGVSASDVKAALDAIGPGPVNVRLNSPGGDVFDGVAIHTLLARHNGTVTVYVDGLAASAASFIMLAGDHVVSARNAFIMIHDAMTMTYGNGDTHRAAADLLDKVSDNIADMYAEKAGEDAAHWRALMTVNGEDGTWYTGQEALASGLVDELTTVPDDEDEDGSVAGLLSAYLNVLPDRARTFVADNDADNPDTPTEEPDTDADAPDKKKTAPDSPDDEPDIEDTADRGLAFAMLAAQLGKE